ncbi:MAG: MGMT family protein [Candidatus Liptonbacteria bacterium]
MENREQSQFCLRVYRATRKIPRGKVATYAQIARAIGHPRACRGVGNALNKNPNSYSSLSLRSPAGRRGATKTLTPCHRVVRSNGSIGGFASGAKKKRALLVGEGVVIYKGKVDLKRYLYS